MNAPYEIELLHFKDPHLLWCENAAASESEPEQIGIYGVIPAETFLDIEEESSKLRRCSTWTPGATLALTEAFLDAKKIIFLPAYIDRRTSIFDSHNHKYGEIIITTRDGKTRKLSKILTKARLAVYDEPRFRNRLATGKLKTELKPHEIEEVLEAIDKSKRIIMAEKQWQEYEKELLCETAEQDKRNYEALQPSQNKESALTVENLHRYNEYLGIGDRKHIDVNLFKGIDELSVGRATTKTKSEVKSQLTATDTGSLLQKKLELIRKSLANVPVKKITPKFDELTSDKDHDTSFRADENKAKFTEETSTKSGALKKLLDVKAAMPLSTSDGIPEKMAPAMKRVPIVEVQKEKLQEKPITTVTCDYNKYQESPKCNSNADDYKPKTTKKSPKVKILKPQQYNPETERRVAYGPPELNRTLLPAKVMPRCVIEENVIVAPVEQDDDLPEDLEQNDFRDVDSNVELEVTTKKTNRTVPLKKESKPAHEVAIANTPTKPTRQSEATPPEKEKKIMCSISERTRSQPVQVQDSDSDGESMAELVKKLTAEYGDLQVSRNLESKHQNVDVLKNYVNPFMNVDKNFTGFVEKIVTPVLMVHSAMNVRIEPTFLMRDMCFNDQLQMKLKNMGVEKPMTIQTVSWFCVLRGYSLIMIGPKGSGKTLGYIPAVCRLLSLNDNLFELECNGPMCIIVCATAASVAEVERLARHLSGDKKICALYTGMTDLDLTTNLFNGCDLLVCTPSILLRLLQSNDFGIDLRRLSTFVLDDCERLSEVYAGEIVYFQKKIKEMLKNRVEKEVQVQYIVVSRVWCDFMQPLSKIAPLPVVCISAFQECVLYSRANTTVSFVTKQNKDNSVLEFLKDIKPCKKTVIVCRDDEEVENLQKILTKEKYNVLACNNTMDVQELYDLSRSLSKYQDSISGLVLICCDGNVEFLNITDANYLVHYSLPTLFSMFCKRFSILNDNYASIFKADNEDLKIKILLEEGNIEQLPKILRFVKRCTTSVPEVLDEICDQVVAEKDAAKAKKLVPVCNSLLSLGQCPDSWNCRERHVLIREYDEPKNWMPTSGEITFKILHYQDAITYSARLLTNVVNGRESKYAQTYSKLALNMAMYFAIESNRKLHGTPKVGDICAVAVKNNLFSRCQVVEILSYYQRGNPNNVLLKLIDDEKLERSRDIYLYHLPEHMEKVETHTIQVRLAGVKPKDKDITFSRLASGHLDAITSADENLYLKGRVALTVGNCVLVDTLETCKDLTFSGTVIRHDLKQELLNRFATTNPEHIPSLETLCRAAHLDISAETENSHQNTVVKPVKELPEVRWAFLDTDELSVTIFTTAIDPATFFVRLAKFEDLMCGLCKDIQAYIAENSESICHVRKGDIVLAKLPDDGMYERARIDEIIGQNKVRCFFVDQGDWRDLPLADLAPITEKFVTRLPFQAIECKLFGVRPPGEDWTDFSNVWLTNNLENADGTKQLYTKCFTKESAQFTGGYKYGVAIIDTNTDEDVIINQAMVDLNMARGNKEEMAKIKEIELNWGTKHASEDDNDDDWENIKRDSPSNEEPDVTKKPAKDPYAFSDNASMSSGGWSCNLNEDFTSLIKPKPSDKIKDLDSESDSKSISVIDSPSPDLERNAQLRNIDDSKHIPLITSPKSLKQKTETKPKVVSSLSSSEVSISMMNTANKGSMEYVDNKSVLSSISSQIVRSRKFNKSLDSDDLTSPEPSQIIKELKPVSTKLIQQVEELRKPKLAWRQNGNKVFVKILIIVDEYQLTIKEKSLKFNCTANYTNYGFDFELYGVVDVHNSKHENKGQYILVCLTTVLSRNWLSLTRDVGLKKWIVYDVDSLDVSSDEDEAPIMTPQISGFQPASDSDDDDFRDDVNFRYSK